MKAPKPLPPLELLNELLIYDPDTGLFRWKMTAGTRAKAGALAGSSDLRGYVLIKLAGINYRAHRLAVKFMTGSDPHGEIDHRNGITSDNRWSNLRTADRAENMQNLGRARRSTSGLLGAFPMKGTNTWISQIKIRGQCIYLGTFDSAKLAHEAYLAAKLKLHPFNPIPRDRGEE